MVKRVDRDDMNSGVPSDDEQDTRMRRRDRDDPIADRDDGYNSRRMSQRDWEQGNSPMSPERRRAFREKWAQTHLPNLPRKEGWHRCWVSTSHPTDTPARRLALGYSIITLEQLRTEGASWAPEATSVKDAGSLEGAVRWREMVGMEWPEEDFNDYMDEFHWLQPRDMARDIYEPIQEMAERVQDEGGRINMGDGFKEMIKFKRRPQRWE